MKQQKIDLTTFDDGKVQVRTPVSAFVIGPLAVHRELGNGYNRWAISHVTTGYRVIGEIKSRASALRMADALQFLDWNFKSPKSRKVKAIGNKVAFAFRLTT